MNKIINFAYLISSISGAALIASNTGYNKFGYVCFLLSSVLTVYMLRHDKKNWSITLTSLIFGVINIVGFLRA